MSININKELSYRKKNELPMLDFKVIENILKEYSYIACAYLYGSYVAGRESPRSDLDIAVLLNDKTPKGRELLHEIDYISYKITGALHIKEVDLVELNTQGLIFTHNVLKTGKLIYDADPSFRIKFMSKVISNYCDFEPTIRFMDRYYFDGYRRRIASL